MMFRPHYYESRPCNNPCKNGGTCEHVADPICHHCTCTSEFTCLTCEDVTGEDTTREDVTRRDTVGIKLLLRVKNDTAADEDATSEGVTRHDTPAMTGSRGDCPCIFQL